MKLHKYTLSQMLDLALCTPEPGAVNFNILRTVLLTLLRQLGLQEHKPWSDSDKPGALQSLLLTHRADLRQIKRAVSDTHLGVVARRSTGDLFVTDIEEADEDEESDKDSQSDKDLQAPTKEEIRKAARKTADPEEKSRIITQMWQATNLMKRVDATEDGIDKISSMMDSFLDEFESLNHVVMEEMKPLFDEFFQKDGMQNFKEKVDLLEEAVRQLETGKADLKEHEKVSEFVEDLRKLCAELEESMAQKLSKDQLYGELGSLKEKLDLFDMFLSTVPNKVSELEIKCDELSGQVSSDKERLDSVSQDLQTVMEQMEMLSESSVMQQRLLDILEKLKRFQSEIDELNRATASLMSDNSSRQMALEDLQHHLDNLKTSKADKDEVFEILSRKADAELVDGKVDRTEFSDIMNEIETQLKSLLSRLMANEEQLRNSLEEMLADIANKLSHDDFDALQAPLKNSIKSVWAKLKRIQRLLDASMNPSAAGVTKCISCGRPATLAGRDIAISGGPDGMRRPDFSGRGLSVRGVSAFDPASGGTSVISLPDNSMRSEVNIIGYDGRLYKGLRTPKHHETDDEDLNISPMYARDGTPEILSRPVSAAGSTTSQGSVTRTSASSRRPPLKKSKQSRREEDKLFSKSRYVGGKHTVGKPLQKGTIHSKYMVPPRKSREDMGLMGTDKQMYRGSVKPKPRKPVDEDEDVDPESEQVSSAHEPSTSRGRGKKTTDTRFCGGRHTMTKPNQRGNIYSNVVVEDEQWEDDKSLVGSDKNIYRGVEYKRPSEVLSQASVGKSVSRSSMSKTKVDLIGSSGRIFTGCIVQLPSSELKVAKKEKGSRRRIFLDDRDY